jgi:hypothetical protein
MFSEIRAWLQPWYNKWAVMVLSAAIGLGGYEWICWSKLTPSDWGTWVGAIGTVLTLMGTIYLATAEARQREKQSMLLARLHSAALASRIASAHGMIMGIARMLGIDGPVTLDQRVADYCCDNLSKITLWSIEEIIPLAPLPDNTAANLVKAAINIQAAVRNVNSIRMLLPETYPGFTDGLVNDTLVKLAQADNWLSQALQVIGDRAFVPTSP